MAAYFKTVMIGCLLGCGRSDIPNVDAGDAAYDVAEVSAEQGCVVETCDGSIICPVDAACAIGDGCNQCLCKKDDGGFHSLCSGNQCDCANPSDY